MHPPPDHGCGCNAALQPGNGPNHDGTTKTLGKKVRCCDGNAAEKPAPSPNPPRGARSATIRRRKNSSIRPRKRRPASSSGACGPDNRSQKTREPKSDRPHERLSRDSLGGRDPPPCYGPATVRVGVPRPARAAESPRVTERSEPPHGPAHAPAITQASASSSLNSGRPPSDEWNPKAANAASTNNATME